MIGCPLCMGDVTVPVAVVAGRSYYLAFIDRDDLPSLDEERRIYSHHQNDPSERTFDWIAEKYGFPLEKPADNAP